jgi:hypothetical protein
MNILKLFGKLSIILLIFFSLQGEVIMRYADFFNGKIEKRLPVPHKIAERQLLIKLQCFTKNFQPATIPQPVCQIDQLIGFEFKTLYFIHNDTRGRLNEPRLSFLRGPPSANS